MPFKPTQSGNTRGRAKGVPNKMTKELKERLKAVLESNLNILNENDAELTNGERIAYVRTLLPYVTPKLNSVTLQDKTESDHFKTIDVRIIRE